MHEQAKAAGLQYFYQAVDLVREKLLGLPRRAATTPTPPPSGAGGYAQSLFARFNIPSAATAGLGSQASDIYSLLSSAVASATATGKSRDVQAEELSASGRLLPRDVASSSDTEKARYISSQREILKTLLSAFDREENNLSDTNDDLAYGHSYGSGLRKNRSDNSFQNIEHEDLGASSLGHKSRSGGHRAASGEGAGWTRGWFIGGGDDAAEGGSDAAGFAQRSVEEIAKASGVDMRR